MTLTAAPSAPEFVEESVCSVDQDEREEAEGASGVSRGRDEGTGEDEGGMDGGDRRTDEEGGESDIRTTLNREIKILLRLQLNIFSAMGSVRLTLLSLHRSVAQLQRQPDLRVESTSSSLVCAKPFFLFLFRGRSSVLIWWYFRGMRKSDWPLPSQGWFANFCRFGSNSLLILYMQCQRSVKSEPGPSESESELSGVPGGLPSVSCVEVE